MTILLTGSSGTIGTRLFERLLDLDYEVIGVDRRENTWKSSLNRRTIRADLLSETDFDDIPRRVDMILHLAANARVSQLITNPREALDNIVMTFNVLEFARRNAINRIMFSSSREVYGDLEGSATEDAVRIDACKNPYSSSKIAAEALIHASRRVYGTSFMIVRFSNVYGMYDDSDRVIPQWIKQSTKDQPLVVFGENKAVDFIYIDDAVDGFIKAMESFDRLSCQTFNIAYGRAERLTWLAQKLRDLVGSQSKIVTLDNRPGEVCRCEPNISRAVALLGFKPKTDLNTGLERAVDWYKQIYGRRT